jgi:hypothetical protein
MEAQPETVRGVIIGVTINRHVEQSGPITELSGFVVRLPDGTEISAEFFDVFPTDKPMSHSVVFGQVAEIALASANQPARILSLGT